MQIVLVDVAPPNRLIFWSFAFQSLQVRTQIPLERHAAS